MGAASTALRVRVAAKTQEASDVCSLDLASADGQPMPAFTAGAHVDLALAPGLTRQYSLCNPPTERHRYQVAVLLEAHSRGGSRAVHALQVGDELDISAPRNHFPLAPGQHASLLLAGGIGVTPILCMAEHLSAAGAGFTMHYSARSRDRAAFLGRIARSAFADRVQLRFDDEPGSGLALPELLRQTPPGTHVYVCGPRGYIDAALGAARAAGHAEDHLHSEVFAAAATRFDSDGGFELLLARSNKAITVAKHQTVIEALAEAGVDVPSSCEQGVCGTCVTAVLQGEPDHRDMVLTPAERASNRMFLPCCSRSKTPTLVLDL